MLCVFWSFIDYHLVFTGFSSSEFDSKTDKNTTVDAHWFIVCIIKHVVLEILIFTTISTLSTFTFASIYPWMIFLFLLFKAFWALNLFTRYLLPMMIIFWNFFFFFTKITLFDALVFLFPLMNYTLLLFITNFAFLGLIFWLDPIMLIIIIFFIAFFACIASTFTFYPLMLERWILKACHQTF